MKRLIYCLPLLLFFACDPSKDDVIDDINELSEPEILVEEYGFVFDNFNVVRDTVRPGDTFGVIMDNQGIPQQQIFEVATTFKDSFDVRRMVVGKPYVILNAKDSLKKAQVFIYEKNKIDYAIVDFRDSIQVYNRAKPITFVEKEASGVITNASSLSKTLSDKNLSQTMTGRLENIYAWTVNFFRLQEGDKFKVIYSERFINDTIPAGIHDIKAAYFEHRGVPLYSFNYVADTINTIPDYYDEEANNLRRAFLKAPVKFSRISSRYNLKRRIRYYGYKVRPHRGTDFAAPYGTPILATADGTVTKSEYRGGNGNYVKIKHNSTYDTQYLHMRKRNAKVGDYVRQGDVIGWIGKTGNSGGPHVCYRFWKNGKQVDPLKEDLPASKPLEAQLQPAYFEFIAPLKEQLDCIKY